MCTIPLESSSCLMASRSARCSAHCRPGLDFTTSRRVTPSGRIDSTPSTAFATGRALVALHTAGLPISGSAYQKGVKYLLSTQQEDGSWFIRSRSMTFQPDFDSGFPHGYDQWLSAAGTSWATLALSLAAPAQTPTAAANEQ